MFPLAPPPLNGGLQFAQVQKTGVAEAHVGLETIDGDWFFNLTLAFSLELGPVGIGLALPLRMRFLDNPPLQERGDFGPLRREDWDQISDFAKFVRYVRIGHKHNPYGFRIGDHQLGVYLRVGALPSASIGHGTLLHQLSNQLDPNQTHLGVALDLHTPYGGFEWLMTSLLQPQVVGGRIYVRPFSFAMPRSYWTRLAVGLSVIGDLSAPYTFLRTLPSPQDATSYDDFIRDYSGLVAIGIDVELDAIRLPWFKLRPYIDVNVLAGSGAGFHAGALMVLSLPFASQLNARLEYRALGPGYIPQYFDSFYNIQRYSMSFYPQSTTQNLWQQVTKRRALELQQETLHGLYGEATFQLKNWVIVGLALDEYQGPNNGNIALTIQVPAFQYFQLNATYIKRGFEGFDQLFQFDDRSMFVAELRVPLGKYFSVTGQYRINWVPDASKAQLAFTPTSQFALFAGAQLQF